MSGHNKWSKIKHKKAATDAAKSKIFSKMARLITVESKNANGDINSPSLRAAIEKAKGVSMPSDNIDRAVKKGESSDAGSMTPVLYEAYGPGGTAIIISGLTDNNNRTAAEIKHTLSKNGTELAASGSAAWAFTKGPDGWEPNNFVDVSDEDSTKLERLVDALDENDDVQDVFINAS